jgi:ribulose-5-phosphate 4-epimerase/fuculose-1-phosphate aldolase
MHFAQIKVSDLVLVDEEGHVLPGGAQHPINGPAFSIHSEIHKARQDIHAACHAHSVYGKAFSCFGKLLEPLYQDAIRFYDDLSLYDAYGGTVVSTEEGRRIAEALGPKNRNVILRNHGIITCGSTVDEAAFLFMSLDRCCHSQLLIDAACGPGREKVFIDEETARITHKRGGNPSKMWLAFQPYYDLAVQEDPNLLN